MTLNPIYTKSEYIETEVGSATESLISEEMVSDDLSASQLADRCMAEANRLFASKAAWRKVDVMDPNIVVETIPLSGEYAQSGVHLVRGVGIIPASAQKFFDFQISREGFQSIDEYLVNHRNVDNFKWVTRPEFDNVPVPKATEHFEETSPYQLMMNRVEWKYPIKRREFVALDVIHNDDMILISKSSLSPLRPGGSRYQTVVPMDEKTLYVDPIDPVKRPLVRAVQYYASKVEPIDENSCRLTMVTWGKANLLIHSIKWKMTYSYFLIHFMILKNAQSNLIYANSHFQVKCVTTTLRGGSISSTPMSSSPPSSIGSKE